MTRALVTFAVGADHERMLEVALPTFQKFADLHGYEVYVAPTGELARSGRPASWGKVLALTNVLEWHDEALWVDADTVIVDPADDVPARAGVWQAMVEHHTPDGHVPNLGVWMVRRPMLPILRQMWAMTRFVNHGWWEQAAMMALLGYSITRPTHLAVPTMVYDHTAFLDPGWNVHVWDTNTTGRPRILHATMHPDRVTTMRNWVLQAEQLADTAVTIT